MKKILLITCMTSTVLLLSGCQFIKSMTPVPSYQYSGTGETATVGSLNKVKDSSHFLYDAYSHLAIANTADCSNPHMLKVGGVLNVIPAGKPVALLIQRQENAGGVDMICGPQVFVFTPKSNAHYWTKIDQTNRGNDCAFHLYQSQGDSPNNLKPVTFTSKQYTPDNINNTGSCT